MDRGRAPGPGLKNRNTRSPAYEEGQELGRLCLEHGLLFSLRRGGSVIRFVPPFTTTEDQMDRAAQILDQAIREAVYDG